MSPMCQLYGWSLDIFIVAKVGKRAYIDQPCHQSSVSPNHSNTRETPDSFFELSQDLQEAS